MADMVDHGRTMSADRATASPGRHHRLPSLSWFKMGGHGRTQSLDGPPRVRTVLHRRSRLSLDTTPRDVPDQTRPLLHVRNSAAPPLRPRSPVITSGRMLHRKAASMDAMSSLASRPFPLAPARREQAIAQTRQWQRELDGTGPSSNATSPVERLLPQGASRPDASDDDEHDLSRIWHSFLGHLEDSVSVLNLDDRDLQSPSSDGDSEPPQTPEMGYLQPGREVLVGLGLGYLSWSDAATTPGARHEPVKAPRRSSSMAAGLLESFSSTKAILGDSIDSLPRSRSSTPIDPDMLTMLGKQAIGWPDMRTGWARAPSITIENVETQVTICYGQAL